MQLKRLFNRKKNHRREPRANAFVLESLEPRLLLSATPMTAAVVTTDHVDYAPGETAVITTANTHGDGLQFGAGEFVRFQVTRTDGMADAAGTTADVGPTGNEAWYVADGVGGFRTHLGADVSGDGVADWIAPDNDLTVNSSISTTWFVEEQYRNSSLLVTAVGQEAGAVASQAFTDAAENTTTTVTSSGGPSVEFPGSFESTYGDAVTFTATVTAAVGANGSPTGTVEFYNGVTLIGTDTTASIVSPTQSSFSLTIDTLSASDFLQGIHAQISAKYISNNTGDSGWNGSTSETLRQIVYRLDITPWITVADKVYDGTTAATETGRGLNGVLARDIGNVVLTNGPNDTIDPESGVPLGGPAQFRYANADNNASVFLWHAQLTGTAASNYHLMDNDYNVGTTANIFQKEITGSFLAANKVYDGTTAATVQSETLTGVIAGDDVNLGGTATFDTANAGTGKTVTLTGATLIGTAASNYKLTSLANTTTTADIDKTDATVTVSGFTGAFDGLAHGATGSAIGVNGEDLSGNLNLGATFTDVPGGIANWTFTGGTNYHDQSGSVAIVINAVAAVATTTTVSSSAATSTYGDAVTFTATVTAVSGTDAPTGTVAVFDGATLLGIDSVTDSSGVGTSIWSFTTTSLTAGAHAIHAVYTATGNFTGSQSADITQTVNQKSLIGDFTVANKVYDGTTAATVLTRTLTGVLGTDDVQLTGGTATFADANVGTGKIVTLTGATLTGAAAGNYSLLSVNTTTADIDKADATVTVSGFTGAFDGLAHGATGSAIGVNGEDLSGNLNLGATFTDVPGGIANWTFTGGTNYHDQSGSVAIVINAVAAVATTTTVSSSAATSTYGDAVTFTATVTAVSGTDAPTGTVAVFDGATLLGIDSVTDSSGVGTSIWSFTTTSLTAGAHAIHAVYTATGNFTGSQSADITQTVNQKSLIGDFTVANKVYDGTTAATVLTRTLTGVLGTDDVQLTGGTATFADANVGTGKIVTLTGATLTGAAAGNYSLLSVNTTTADIDKADATVTVSGFTGAFDGLAHGATGSAIGVNGEDLSGNLNLGATFTDVPGGIANWTFTGGTNYHDQSGSVAIVINAVAAVATTTTVSSSAATSTYGDAVTFTATVTAVSGTDAPTGTVAVFDGATLLGIDSVTDSSGVGTSIWSFTTTSLTAGAHAIHAVYTATGNFTGSQSADITQTVNQKSLIGDFTVANKVYDGTTAATVLTRTLTGVLGTDDVQLTGGTATFADANVGTGKIVTLTGATLTGAAAGNYSLLSVNTTTADIDKADATVTVSGFTGAFDGLAHGATGSAIGVNGEDLSGNLNLGATFTDVPGGIANWTFTGGTNYHDQSGSVAIVINAVAAVATTTTVSSSAATSTYGDAVTFTATVTAVSGTDAPTGTVAVFDGATLLGIDSVTDSSGVGTSIWSFTTTSLTAGAHAIHAVYTATGNFTGSQSADITQTVNQKSLIGDFTVANKVYDGTTAATVLTRTLTGVLGTDDVQLTGGTATFADANVGTGKIVTLTGATLTGAAAGNYSLLSVNTTTADIDKADATVTVSGFTGAFDGLAHGATGSAIGVNGEDLSGNLNLGATFTDVPGGIANWTFTGGTNYHDQSGSVAIVINAVAAVATTTTVSSSAATSTYGDAVTFTATVTAVSGTDAPTGTVAVFDGATLLGIDSVTDSSGVGTSIWSFTTTSLTAGAHAIHAVYTATGNFTGSQSADITQTVNQKSLIGDFTVANKVYDGTTAATVLTRTLTGVLGTDDVQLTGGTATFADANVGTGKIVTLTGATFTGAAAGNYSLASVNTTTADITALGITVTGDFTVANKVYDGTTAATVLTRTLTGVLGTDDVQLTGGTATFADANVGLGKTVTLTGATLTGAAASNYSLLSVATATADITALGITGSITVANKVYDGTTAAAETSRGLNGVLASDIVNVILSNGPDGPAAFQSAKADFNAAVYLMHAVLTGTAASNYRLTDANIGTTANISWRNATGSFAAMNKVYDGTTAATVQSGTLETAQPGTLTGVIAGDDVNLAGTATFDTANVGTDKTVTLTGATLIGAAAGNYTLTPLPNTTTTADITKANAVVTLTSYVGTYDGAAHQATGTATGVLGEDLSAGLNLSVTSHSNAGVYIDTVTFTDGTGNYKNTIKNVKSTINKANAMLVLIGYHGTYDGAAHQATGTATGVLGEDLSAGLNLSVTSHSNAGVYIDTVTFTDETGNYKNTIKNVKSTINKANATLVLTGYYGTYDGAAHQATGTATGVLGESLAGLDLSVTSHSNAGVYIDTVTFTDGTGNYKNTIKNVKSTIRQANAGLTVTGYSVTFDGLAHTATGTATGVLGEDLSAGLDLSSTTHTNVGTYLNVVTFTDVTGNYKFTVKNVSSRIL